MLRIVKIFLALINYVAIRYPPGWMIFDEFLGCGKWSTGTLDPIKFGVLANHVTALGDIVGVGLEIR